MSTSRKPASLAVQRIAVNAQGYDSSGAYWGAGPDVFIVTTGGGADEVTVRAKSAAEARAKAAIELERPPGQPRVKEPIGGASPHKTRYEIDWRDPVSSAVIKVRITQSRDYLGQGQDHIEVHAVKPAKAPLPISETGYRSHFMTALELINAGGPVVFVTAWLDREAKSKDWTRRQTARQQGDLFAWAEAQSEVGAEGRKPRTPKAAARRGRDRGRAPE
jgi:hypothetical protein